MFHTLCYRHNLSLQLSEVLDDIGVNEKIVLKRRDSLLLIESMLRFMGWLKCGLLNHVFGSLSEATTTEGIDSDHDVLALDPKYNVIQDYTEWEPGLTNLLMVQDDKTAHGYCLLQLLRSGDPDPATDVPDESFVKDMKGRVLLKNTLYLTSMPSHCEQHGPSWTSQGAPGTGISEFDHVPAFLCKSWPKEAKDWLQRKGIGNWPTTEMKKYAENSGCFVVPVASKVSQFQDLEWRISTSKAERCLMFSLNITQIRCYVLMKMMLKTILNHPGEGKISSFMCKTVLLYCIENTASDVWQERYLYEGFSRCLISLYSCLKQENCPHFIIPGNNLMARQFSPEVKTLLLEKMSNFIQSNGNALFEINIDDLGPRLRIKMNKFPLPEQQIYTRYMKCLRVTSGLLLNIAKVLSSTYIHILFSIKNKSVESMIIHLIQTISNLARYNRDGNDTDQRASCLLLSLVCSTLGCVLASSNIQTNNHILPDAVKWLSEGLNVDAASGRLKLASVFYCAGDMEKAESILRDTQSHYELDIVEPMCSCHPYREANTTNTFSRISFYDNERAIKVVCAFCVKFTRQEFHCVPRELQYEMFRSTREDFSRRLELKDFWMDWAVVDSLPFLYFLQFKTYGYLNRIQEQQKAYDNLTEATIGKQRNLSHRETALNLLGQCMEQVNKPDRALICYEKSLAERQSNNVANIHICRLMANLVRDKL